MLENFGIELDMDSELLKFLQEQKLVAIATTDENGKPWVANVYYSVDKAGRLFFVTAPETKHGQHISASKDVAFTISWYDKTDLGNRKAVQGLGTCERLNDPIAIGKFLLNHYIYFPSWKEVINEKSMREKIIDSRPYIITPSYMKFWNDELYGEEGTKDFTF